MMLRLLCVVVISVLALTVQSQQTEVPVQVSVKAAMQEPPIGILVLQTMIDTVPLSASLRVFEDVAAIEGLCERDIYDQLVANNKLLTETQKQLIGTLVALKDALPLINAQYQFTTSLATGCIAVHNKLPEQLSSLCSHIEMASLPPIATLLQFNAKSEQADVVLVAEQLGDKNLLQVITLAKKLDVNVALLWKEPALVKKWVTVSGYGVEMAIKSTEYKVTDDQIVVQDSTNTLSGSLEINWYDLQKMELLYPNVTEEQWAEYNDYITEKYQNLSVLFNGQLKEKQIVDLGFKFASEIMKSPCPLHTMTNIGSHLPLFTQMLSKRSVIKDLQLEVQKNEKLFAPILPPLDPLQANAGPVAVLMNGLPVDLVRTDIFHIVHAMRFEVEAVEKISKVGLTTSQSIELISSSSKFDKLSINANSELPIGNVYDIRQTWERPGRTRKKTDLSPVIYWNDLETDSRYKQLSSKLMELMTIQRQGQLPRIKRNIINVIVACSPLSAFGIGVVVKSLEFVKNNIPVRFGFLPVSQDGDVDEGVAITAIAILAEYYGKKALSSYMELLGSTHAEQGHLLLSDIKDSYDKIIRKNAIQQKKDALEAELTFEDIQSGQFPAIVNAYVDSTKQMAMELFLRKDDDSASIYSGAIFVNGVYYVLDQNWAQQVNNVAAQHIAYLQKALYFGKINDKTDVLHHLLSTAKAKKRRNPYITGASELLDVSTLDLNQVLWLTADKSNASSSLTLIINVNESLGALIQALSFLNSGTLEANKTRLLVVGCSTCDLSAIGKYQFSEETVNTLKLQVDYGKDLLIPASTVFINGRLIGPFKGSYFLLEQDYKMLCQLEYKKVKAVEMFIDKNLDSDASEKASKVLSVYNGIQLLSLRHATGAGIYPMGTLAQDIRRDDSFSKFYGKHSSFVVGDKTQASVQFVAILDPFSVNAQKVSAILSKLADLSFVSIQVFLNPTKISGDLLPVNRFFRFNFQTSPEFTNDGQRQSSVLKFLHLPEDCLLTLGMDVPQAWVVMQSLSLFDLDNIKLSNVKTKSTGLVAEMELENILIEGHATDSVTGGPPRGLQFILSNAGSGFLTDTIVMANLGYFQLKANPGIWNLLVREGRSRQFYNLTNVQYSTAIMQPDAEGSIILYLTKFTGLVLLTTVRKNDAKLAEDLLAENSAVSNDESSNSWSSWMSWGSTDTSQKVKNADINIFSVASGHLYERFLRIMILSVLKNTKHSVKFWFIENFLSPLFKNFIPYMAKKYDFQYELVTYKWPKWLRAQQEKQRMIWGYKILFLDVLFPLSLGKVIFVDADQIVRTDLKQLVDINLRGAPYGYTPFCNSRKEIESLRFWKNGYWKEHLAGKSYHISALYVIDLNRFRMIAAGDRLRQHYQMVSADPGSLANLDQDLPNDMQNELPIFSLPQEWLWCETWCDDASLKTAKTIDLCNNPMTKEPKLERARRMLPEWNVYDEEARTMFDQWKIDQHRQKADDATVVTHTKDEL